jgi:pyruvate/2-oxoacid:ferredoxin oxidoreductase alpha subunit
MAFTKMMEGNEAAAWGAKLSRAQVIPVYPITPQTELINYIGDLIAQGKFDAKYIKVEGEHSAIGAAIGASRTGARVFTASASQGIAFMEEGLCMVPGLRLPIVMCMVNRALAPLGSLQPDHNDSLMQRDNGWIQLYCENSQEVLDTIIQAYKIGENRDIYLPVAVCYDGYYVSATAIPTMVPDQKKVDGFLPSYRHEWYSLIPEEYRDPGTRRDWAQQRYEMQLAHEAAKKVIEDVDEDYRKRFNRGYDGLLEPYNCKDVDAVLVAMGSMVGTGKDAIDIIQEKDKRVGLIKLRCFRPFPTEEMVDLVKNVHAVGVIDRNNSIGSAGGGIVSLEVARALYEREDRPLLLNFHTGLAGTDVTLKHFEYMADECLKAVEEGKVRKKVDWVDLHPLGGD